MMTKVIIFRFSSSPSRRSSCSRRPSSRGRSLLRSSLSNASPFASPSIIIPSTALMCLIMQWRKDHWHGHFESLMTEKSGPLRCFTIRTTIHQYSIYSLNDSCLFLIMRWKGKTIDLCLCIMILNEKKSLMAKNSGPLKVFTIIHF